VRAGKYAIVDGVEYQARFADGNDSVALYVPRDEPQPDGFEWDDRLAGHWSRDVPSLRVQRLFEVETWALLLGKFPVQVIFIGAGDIANIMYDHGYTIGYGLAPRDENGKVMTPPGMFGNPRESLWDGSCDVADLSDVRETVREVPLVPIVRSPTVGPTPPRRPKRPKPRSFH
jgi:hypothetical protein